MMTTFDQTSMMMDSRTLRLVLGGLKSYFPALNAADRGAVGRSTGAYCYSVWMRHLSIITKVVPSFSPRVVVELGPGHSLGVGCAALLSGFPISGHFMPFKTIVNRQRKRHHNILRFISCNNQIGIKFPGYHARTGRNRRCCKQRIRNCGSSCRCLSRC